MFSQTIPYLIIGAGPTGLGAAYRLKELGEENFLVIEKESKAGGLASSFVDDKGFTWDIGGHVQFSHYSYFDDVMARVFEKGGWLEHKRSAWAYLLGRFIPYPVQNNLRHLPQEQLNDCLRGIRTIDGKSNPRNFREWIVAMFGTGLAELFMLPYNFKVWAHPPETMSYQWIGERVAVTNIEDVLKNITLETDDATWGPNNMFRFPKSGGTGGIWENVARIIGNDKFAYGKSVRSINTTAKQVTCTDGSTYRYQHLISTMPLDVLCTMVQPALPVQATALRHSSSNIVGLGLKGQCPDHLKTKSWIYFSEPDCPFYRATIFSNYSPNNVPDAAKYWSIMTETSESDQKPINHDTLIQETIQGCINTGLITSEDQVCSRWYHRAEYGYPVPSLERDTILRNVIPALDALSVYSRGRFGGWKYEISNQDHSLMQGVELANRLVSGEREKIYTID